MFVHESARICVPVCMRVSMCVGTKIGKNGLFPFLATNDFVPDQYLQFWAFAHHCAGVNASESFIHIHID